MLEISCLQELAKRIINRNLVTMLVKSNVNASIHHRRKIFPNNYRNNLMKGIQMRSIIYSTIIFAVIFRRFLQPQAMNRFEFGL